MLGCADVTTPVVACRGRQAQLHGVAMHRAHHIMLAGLANAFHGQAASVAIVHGRDKLSAERRDLAERGEQRNDRQRQAKGSHINQPGIDDANGRIASQCNAHRPSAETADP